MWRLLDRGQRIAAHRWPSYDRFTKPGLLLGLGGALAAACGLQVAADASDTSEGLPTDKLACRMGVAAPRRPTVLVSCGSFNPPTIMHLRMVDLATAALAQRGYDVWGCYTSPVADAYGKKGLAPVHDRLSMCQLAAADTSNVMVDAWEASQPGYTRTLQVLKRVAGVLQSYMQQNSSLNDVSQVHAAGLAAAAAAPSTSSSSSQTPTGQAVNRNSRSRSSSSSSEDAAAQVPRVMLLCGADLLATIAQPGVWRDPDIILRDHGVVCIFRQGTDVQALLDTPGTILHEYKENIILVEEPVANNVSSTKIRQLLAAGQPVRYLLPDSVIAYIKSHGLYT